MVQIPLREWSCVDLNNTVFNKSFSSDKFVIRSIINDIENSSFSGDWFWGPVEVTFFKSEGSEFIISTSDSDSSNSWFIIDEFSIWYWSGFLKGSFFFMNWHSATSWSSFMSWISWDTHFNFYHKKIWFIN